MADIIDFPEHRIVRRFSKSNMEKFSCDELDGMNNNQRIDYISHQIINDVMAFLYEKGFIYILEDEFVIRDFAIATEIIKGAMHRSQGLNFYIHDIVNAIRDGAIILSQEQYDQLIKNKLKD